MFESYLSRHREDMEKLQHVYGQKMFEKKRDEQYEKFHQMAKEGKFAKEYESLRALLSEKGEL
jgi:hypothetical protein